MVNKPRKSSAKRNRSRTVIIIQSTSAIGPKHRRCNLKHLRFYETLAMKTKKLSKLFTPRKMFFFKKQAKKSPRHSVQLIKNTCDFLLKQLGMFSARGPEGERKIVEHLATMPFGRIFYCC